MDKAVAELNIEHYRKLLSTETDPTRRATLERLLAEEEAKLAALRTAIDEGDASGVADGNPFARVRQALKRKKR